MIAGFTAVRVGFLAAIFSLAAACGASGGGGGGELGDAGGVPPVTEVTDAAAPLDAGPGRVDAGVRLDGGQVAPSDAGARADAGLPTDGGMRLDAGASADAGVASDAGADRVSEVCSRWIGDRADRSEGTWSGNIAACNAGDVSPKGRTNALKILNLYRFLAALPALVTDATRDAKAQACALMMDANNALSHTPPASWACYSDAGAEAAGRSNIATTPGVQAVDLYMVDPGNETTMGHRRWILSNSIGPTGLGSTSDYSCMWTLYGRGNVGKTWMAWPPPGPFPYGAVKPSWKSIDQTGWTLQSDSINLAGAQVSVTESGQTLAVQTSQLLGGYGSRYAIKFIPQGWTISAGRTYAVRVTGITSPISYDVQVVACN